MYLRRARPTLRLLNEDLDSGWDSPQPKRDVQSGALTELHPLSALPHPLIAKALSSFDDDPANDNYVGPIASSTELPLMEIKVGQWRGGVWHDSELSVCWVVVAGLAKGDHEDHDDFYKRVSRENVHGDPTRWLPTSADVRLLKRERAAQMLTDWELAVQRLVLTALRQVGGGGSTQFEIPHPSPKFQKIATITLCISAIREDGYEADEAYVDIIPEQRDAGSHLFWQATLRILITLDPPQQGWDRFKDTFSNIAEPGRWSNRVDELEGLVQRAALAESIPGQTAHYAHRDHIAGSTVEGTAIRALCGVFFVSTQLPDTLPSCPDCSERWNRLPAG